MSRSDLYLIPVLVRRRRRWPWVLLLLFIVMIIFASSAKTSSRSGGSAAGGGQSVAVASVNAPGPLPVSAISADSTAGGGIDAGNQPVSFAAANLIDGNSTTAWRTDGDASGQSIHLTLDAPSHVTVVGLIPGYAKLDPETGADRFPQNRRVTAVTWTDDTGAMVTQTFTDTGNMQQLPVDFSTAGLTVTIASVTADGGRDYTAISEIEIIGTR